MHLGQIRADGRVIAAIFEGGQARPIPATPCVDLIRRAEVEGVHAGRTGRATGQPARRTARSPLLPIHPKEVWACGCTYETSAASAMPSTARARACTRYVYREPRPEIFFKGTARVCVGPGQAIGIRPDSKFTAPEPELAVVLGSRGRILGYTLANDVSAWDIERENPLYLPQSKVYNACCALGPVIVTADELPDPYQLEMTCTIERGGEGSGRGSVSTARLNRRIRDPDRIPAARQPRARRLGAAHRHRHHRAGERGARAGRRGDHPDSRNRRAVEPGRDRRIAISAPARLLRGCCCCRRWLPPPRRSSTCRTAMPDK